MKPLLVVFVATAIFCLCIIGTGSAHGVGSTPITWNREISRLFYDRCASCHRSGGSAFSLMTYSDAQPRANEIKDAVLARRMPPWGAVKGFGSFRNDQSLMQEQIELISRWVDGGIRRGNNPNMLPKAPTTFAGAAPSPSLSGAIRVSGPVTLPNAALFDGLLPEGPGPWPSSRIIAVLPGGFVEPLVWLHDYNSRHAHPFLFRKPIHLPAGTQIQGVPSNASVALLPVLGQP